MVSESTVISNVSIAETQANEDAKELNLKTEHILELTPSVIQHGPAA
jgi:hypothetical protein